MKKPKTRRPPVLTRLLKALDARADVTILSRTWPVMFVQLRYVLSKTVVNPNGMSPLHRETPLFYGQAWRATRGSQGWSIEPLPKHATVIGEYGAYVVLNPSRNVEEVEAASAVCDCLGPICPEVSERLGLTQPVQREPMFTGRPMER